MPSTPPVRKRPSIPPAPAPPAWTTSDENGHTVYSVDASSLGLKPGQPPYMMRWIITPIGQIMGKAFKAHKNPSGEVLFWSYTTPKGRKVTIYND